MRKLFLILLAVVSIFVFTPTAAQAAQPTWLCARAHPYTTIPTVQFHFHYTSDYYDQIAPGALHGEGGCGIIGALQTNGYPFGFTLPPGYCAHFRPGEGTRPANTWTQGQINWLNAGLMKRGTYSYSTFWDFRTLYSQYYGTFDYGSIIFDVKIFPPVNNSCA